MKISHIFNATVRQGKLIIANRKKFDEYIGQRKFEGKDFTVTIERRTAQRSLPQNKYYWVLMTIIAEELGYTKEEAHDMCRKRYLVKHEGTGVETLISTTNLDKIEFGEYIEKIKIWVATGEDMPVIVLPDAESICSNNNI